MNDADARVERLILNRWRTYHEDHADCPTLHVVKAETDFALLYDTGVEGVEFTAELACDHRGHFVYYFAEMGELPDIIEELAKDYPDE